jgi:hypothetical protein
MPASWRAVAVGTAATSTPSDACRFEGQAGTTCRRCNRDAFVSTNASMIFARSAITVMPARTRPCRQSGGPFFESRGGAFLDSASASWQASWSYIRRPMLPSEARARVNPPLPGFTWRTECCWPISSRRCIGSAQLDTTAIQKGTRVSCFSWNTGAASYGDGIRSMRLSKA